MVHRSGVTCVDWVLGSRKDVGGYMHVKQWLQKLDNLIFVTTGTFSQLFFFFTTATECIMLVSYRKINDSIFAWRWNFILQRSDPGINVSCTPPSVQTNNQATCRNMTVYDYPRKANGTKYSPPERYLLRFEICIWQLRCCCLCFAV